MSSSVGAGCTHAPLAVARVCREWQFDGTRPFFLPYSEKLLNFLTEAQLTNSVDIVRCAVNTPTMEAVSNQCRGCSGG